MTCFANGATQKPDGNDTRREKKEKGKKQTKKKHASRAAIFFDETKKVECERCVRANLNRLI